MRWHFHSDQAIYLQIIDQLKTAIICGIYPPGSRLPSIRELSIEAGVNPNTVQRALSVLESEQLIVTQRNAGKSVSDDVARISQLRRSYGETVLSACISKLKSLGFTDDEIAESFAAYVQPAKGKETEHD